MAMVDGEIYKVCKDHFLWYVLRKSRCTIDFGCDYTYGVREYGEKSYTPISKKVFDKYLDEAYKEGAQILHEYFFKDYSKHVPSRPALYEYEHCSGCLGCITVENSTLDDERGDRTYWEVQGIRTAKCAKCGKIFEWECRVDMYNELEHMQKASGVCRNCGRLVDRRKQESSLKNHKF